MATRAQCRSALDGLAARLAEVPHEVRQENAPNRTLACTLSDLETSYVGRLHDGQLQDIAEGDPDGADIRLTMDSDDLLALADGKLNFAGAWARGRVKIDASMRDLLRLRQML